MKHLEIGKNKSKGCNSGGQQKHSQIAAEVETLDRTECVIYHITASKLIYNQ